MTSPARLVPLLLASALAACSAAGDGSARSPLERGTIALAEGDPRTARVELMNAIKADPRNGGIHLLQAQAYLLLEDGAAAEAEVARARALGVAPSATHHVMAHALLLQGKADAALQEADRSLPEFAGYAGRIRGKAFMLLGNNDAAATAFDEALAAAPQDVRLWTEVARFRRVSGEMKGAIEAADRAIAIDGRSVEALSLRGELTRSQYGLTAAIAWFDRALDVDPKHVPTLVERAATLGDLGRMKAMLDDTRAILSLSPNHAVAYYLQAMLAARARKYELARSLYERTRGALDNQPAAMLLASAIELETGNAERAIQRLRRLVGLQPDNAKARRLLASAQWRLGDADGVIATLLPSANRPDADAFVLTLVGKALLKRGNAAAAAPFLARAAEPTGRSASALLGEPLDAAGLETLRMTAERTSGDALLQVRLVRALLAAGLGDEALSRARTLQHAFPGAPDSHLLVGDALGMRGEHQAAAEQYRRAANISFTEPVAMRLIEALGAAGDARGSARVLELFLQQNPNNVRAQLLAANSFIRAGRWDEAIPLYEKLRRRIGDRDATLLNNLAWAYSEKGDYARGLPLARRAWELDRRNPATTDTYGWLLFKSGSNRAQGLALLNQAARGAPSDRQIRQHLQAAGG